MYGMSWKDYLTDQERERLAQIKGETRTLKLEHRRIYDRCRKRLNAAKCSKSQIIPEPKW